MNFEPLFLKLLQFLNIKGSFSDSYIYMPYVFYTYLLGISSGFGFVVIKHALSKPPRSINPLLDVKVQKGTAKSFDCHSEQF